MDGQFADIWLAPRSAEAGPWPHLACTRAKWSIAEIPRAGRALAPALTISKPVAEGPRFVDSSLEGAGFEPSVPLKPSASRNRLLSSP
jgi:hypothetical protein